MNTTRHLLVLPLVLGLAVAASAQATVAFNSGNGYGCQTGGPVLEGGTPAGAEVAFDYDATTAMLHVTVTNTSPVTAGVPNPLITRIWFNVPGGAVTGASLMGQSGSGGAAPAFALTFDADAATAPNPNHANCFGYFNFQLARENVQGGIANANAGTIGGPAGAAVIGPVEFHLQLQGPGVGGLTSDAFAAATSRGGAQRNVAVACKFQAGGPGAEESGTLGSNDECRTAVFVRGTPNIGEHIQICVHGSNGCHVCLWVSVFAGPVTVNNVTIPIGIPILASFDLGNFTGGTTELCLHVQIPNAPQLVGQPFYFSNLTYPLGQPELFSFSPAFQITIGQ